MHVYVIRTGHLYNLAGALVATGYSGHGEGLNNPAMVDRHALGPLPPGLWTIGPAHTHGHLGPVVMALTPTYGVTTFGRSAFFIHGDNAAANHTASDGCLVFGPAARRSIANSYDRFLLCVPEESDRQPKPEDENDG